MNRYTPTERIGINEVEKVIIKNIDYEQKFILFI